MQDFEYLKKLVRKHSAIILEDRQKYLMEPRLMPLVRQENLESISALIEELNLRPFNGLHKCVVDAMTTNETSFLRDFHPFEILRTHLLPELIEKRKDQKELAIWSAACSSGQEPYSISMILKEDFLNLSDWKVKIIASDLSQDMLEKAKEGNYSQMEVNRGLPAVMLVKYFEKWGIEWKLKHEILRMVEFLELNLAGPWPRLPKFDIIFLRNVMIYFDIETKKEILRKVKCLLKPDGFLFLGGAETTLNLDDSFKRYPLFKAGVYQLSQKGE